MPDATPSTRRLEPTQAASHQAYLAGGGHRAAAVEDARPLSIVPA